MAIVKQYFTYRLLEYESGKFIDLTILDKRIKNVPSLKYKSIYSSPMEDGRILGVVTFCNLEIELNVIEECLSILAYHPKTEQGAKDFVSLLSNNLFILNTDTDDCYPVNITTNFIFNNNNSSSSSSSSDGCGCGK